MSSFSSLRVRLVGTVFLAVAPVSVLMYFIDLPWAGFACGLLALGAAWFGGERFIIKQVKVLCRAAQGFAAGDLSSRTGLAHERSELGELARAFDSMAATLEQRVKEREQSEKALLNRSFQQTVVGALGQFALVSNDFAALLKQAAMLVAQTLEVEFCYILELRPERQILQLREGAGWKEGLVGKTTLRAHPHTQEGFTLTAGEPVVVDDLTQENRFECSALLIDHKVLSSATVAISGHGRAFGVLGAHTTRLRKFTEDEVHFLLAVGSVLAMAVERKRAEMQLQKLAAFAQLYPNPAMELSAGAAITYANDAARKLAASIVPGEGFVDATVQLRSLMPANIGEIVRACLATNQSVLRLEAPLGGRTLSWSLHPVRESQVVHAYVDDITDRLNLEAQLRQSQKMESIGQLAAGVAHDFNNMLTVIQGHSGLLTARTLPQDLHDSVQAIYFAAERAAGLTRQLLMFSRKNVMQPKLLDLREIVANVSKMLQRLLGETVNLQLYAPEEIPLIQADTGMLEQVLMNLAVNARDAMPKGGTLSVSTGTVEIDEIYVETHPEAKTGPHVCLQVTDTGCGMEAATMSRIFEPFFTTKEVGKGTGLGLATVYGIVKQHGGWIEVASALNRGTTFEVYFPAGTAPVQAKAPEAPLTAPIRGGSETILVVEDEPVLREMAHLILTGCGYRILEADTGVQALRLWEKYRDSIDLVLTDMVMPEGMSGMELAEKLHATKPTLKIIIASGYSMDSLDTSFVRDGHAAFLQKPYTHITLANAVRECLDRRTETSVP